MKKKRMIAVIALCLISLLLLSSCSTVTDQKDTKIGFELEGEFEARKITILAKNRETEEKVRIVLTSRDEYVTTVDIDYGVYEIEKIYASDDYYEYELTDTGFLVTEGYLETVSLDVQESNIQWTFRWIWKRNGITIIGLPASIIALVIVKARKRLFVVGKSEGI